MSGKPKPGPGRPGSRQGIRRCKSGYATAIEAPHDLVDSHGSVRVATIAAYGDTRHTMVDRSRYHGPFLPGFVSRTPIVDLAGVDAMRAAGVEFLATADSYYDDPELRARIGRVRVPIEQLKARSILVDRDEDGYLLQIYTRPVQDRRRSFFELIERHGSLGFGKGNFKALFQAIEREQELRGNL